MKIEELKGIWILRPYDWYKTPRWLAELILCPLRQNEKDMINSHIE